MSSRAQAVAFVAREFAEDVDASARHPIESIQAMRDQGLLGCLVRDDAELRDVARAATLISEACSSSGSIFAMHQSQVFTLKVHGEGVAFGQLIDRVAADEILIASCLSESTTGGDPGQSTCSVLPSGNGVLLDKQSPAISYGAIADGIMVSARRGPDADPHDQVLVFCPADSTEVSALGAWDSLGMRGTGSGPFSLSARVPEQFVFVEPFSMIGTQTMIPASHVLWAASWLGIAREAVRRALAYLRTSKDRGTPLETARNLKLARARRLLAEMSLDIDYGCRRVQANEGGLTAARTTYFNDLKVRASESLHEVVSLCLQIIGITGYLNAGEFTLARLIRDAQSAPLMVSNQRIELNNARAARAPLESP